MVSRTIIKITQGGCCKIQPLVSVLYEGYMKFLKSDIRFDGVTRIGMGAFEYSGITSVTLPSSLKQIDMGAFFECPLTDIYFDGTSEQWSSINIANDYNENLINGNIHFTEKNVVSTEQGISITFGNTPAPQSDEITVNVNGSPVSFDQPPIILNDRTMVPLRAIFEALGAKVEWNGEKQTIVASKEDVVILMEIGQNKFARQVIGSNITFYDLDVAPMILNERTLVPARTVAESFDCTVDWDDAARTVDIWK